MTRMRGDDPVSMFSHVSAEQRVPQDHKLRAIRALVDDVLGDMSREFDRLYATVGAVHRCPPSACFARSCSKSSIRYARVNVCRKPYPAYYLPLGRSSGLSEPWILAGEQSLLPTHTATTESVSLRVRMKADSVCRTRIRDSSLQRIVLTSPRSLSKLDAR